MVKKLTITFTKKPKKTLILTKKKKPLHIPPLGGFDYAKKLKGDIAKGNTQPHA